MKHLLFAILAALLLAGGAYAQSATAGNGDETVPHHGARGHDNDDDGVLPDIVAHGKYVEALDAFTLWHWDKWLEAPVWRVLRNDGLVDWYIDGVYFGTFAPDYNPLPGPNGETTWAKLNICFDFDDQTPSISGLDIEFFSFGVDDLHQDIQEFRESMLQEGHFEQCPPD